MTCWGRPGACCSRWRAKAGCGPVGRWSQPQASGGGRFLPGIGCDDIDPTDGSNNWSEQQGRGAARDGYWGASRQGTCGLPWPATDVADEDEAALAHTGYQPTHIVHMLQGWNERMEKVKSPGATEEELPAGWNKSRGQKSLNSTNSVSSPVLIQLIDDVAS